MPAEPSEQTNGYKPPSSEHLRTAIVWFRRDLRLSDHTALERAARESDRVVCAFVLDPELLRGPTVSPHIVAFFFDAVAELRENLRARGSDLALLEGEALEQLRALAGRTGASALYYNVDYTPDALDRDARVTAGFEADGRGVTASVDHVYYGADEVGKDDGGPYTVYTPYRKRWLERHERAAREPADSLGAIEGKLAGADVVGASLDVPVCEAYGRERPATAWRSGEHAAAERLEAFLAGPADGYGEARDFPAVAGTSGLSPHLRAGTIGVRTCVEATLRARSGARGTHAEGLDTWLTELIWRDFYQQILRNYPRVATGPFRQEAEAIPYRDAEDDWRAWCDGRTGYPIVDAAMIQLNEHGWMHNRLRMIVASFLTKDLLIDYRRGERYFEQHLVDGDTAANNGGWQWSASTGTDAAPYFRIFNPVSQSERFDPEGDFIREMIPALRGLSGRALHAPWTASPVEAAAAGFELGRDYPAPIVDHAAARARALAVYAPVLGRKPD